MRGTSQIRDRLRAYVDRERSARPTRLRRDLDPPRDRLVGDWPALMGKRAREYRIFGRLQALAREYGFDVGYDSELDAHLKQEGFSLTECGAIRRHIVNGYLRDLGQPDETGRLTPPRAYLEAMLIGRGEPVTEAELTNPGPVTNSLTEVAEELIAHKGATWDEKIQRQHRSVAAMLGDIARTDDLRQIRHAHLAAYIQNLRTCRSPTARVHVMRRCRSRTSSSAAERCELWGRRRRSGSAPRP
jgi:hypothetical protein